MELDDRLKCLQELDFDEHVYRCYKAAGDPTMVQLQPNDIHSLTDFQRNTKAHLARLRESGRPEVLTVNGRAEVVLLAPTTYARLAELAHEAETLRGMREALEQADRGELTPLEAFDRRFRRDHGVPS